MSGKPTKALVLWENFYALPLVDTFKVLQRAARFYIRAQTAYDVHSPFLSDWITDVLEDDRHYYAFEEVDAVREYWRKSPQAVLYDHDHGAGSRSGQGTERKASDMVDKSGIDARSGERLFRMVQYARPKTMLELGTNLGLSALYLRSAARSAQFITIEGHEVVARLARETFKRTTLPPPDIRRGTFAEQLPVSLAALGRVDFAWLDGDHRGTATVAYFQTLLPYLHADSVVVIGDIHWSDDMESGWQTLANHPAVTASVDLFELGVLFFKPSLQHKQQLTLVPSSWKPWRMGFF